MKEKIVKLIELFLILSPLFDMLTAFMLQVLNIDFTIGMIVRFIIILICLFYLVFIYKSKDKKYLLLILGSIFIYLVIFLLVMGVNKDINILLYESKNALKTFYLPILLIKVFNQNDVENVDKILHAYLLYPASIFRIELFYQLISLLFQ